MQELSPNLFIETSYVGVTLGVINLPHGLILIDAPPRPEDGRSWRSALSNLSGGVDRLLINLDAHPDRTLGVRTMECTVVAHEKTAQVFRNRPTTFKAQNGDTGAEWELVSGLGSVRWCPPEITFSQHLLIHWGDQPVILEHHPGPTTGAIWVIVPETKVIFVGDAVTLNSPPFLANADLPPWLITLKTLHAPEYKDYFLISSRGDVLTPEQANRQTMLLQQILDMLNELTESNASPDATDKLVEPILSKLQYPPERKEQFTKRLKWGLYQYYTRHLNLPGSEGEE